MKKNAIIRALEHLDAQIATLQAARAALVDAQQATQRKPAAKVRTRLKAVQAAGEAVQP